MAALQANLQATKGLIQGGHYGSGGEIVSPVPRSMRLNVPKFSRTDSDRATPLPTKWISLAERADCLCQGLCFNCDNKWVREHNFLGKFLLLMADEDEVTGQSRDGEKDDAMESGDISILNSLVGYGSPRHNFLGKFLLLMADEDEVMGQSRDGEKDDAMESGDISILNSLVGYARGSGVHAFIDHRKVLDIVLGIQRFQKLRKVTHGYSMQTMEFTWLDQGHGSSKKKMAAGIQRRIWKLGINNFFRQHLEGKVVSKE
nr:hypothetical protein [Tanacetum cinerariifolium]